MYTDAYIWNLEKWYWWTYWENCNKPDSMLKSRDISLLTKLHIAKTMAFPVVICRCESWTIQKAERWRNDAFKLWCWRRLLRVPGTARTSNQSILKEINPEYSLEGLMPKLKLQYFDHVMSRANSLEKTLMLGKSEGKRRREQQRMRWLDSTTNSMDMNLSNLQEIVKDREARHASPQGYKVSGMTWQVNNTIVSKNPPVNSRDMGSIPGLGKFHIPWGK